MNYGGYYGLKLIREKEPLALITEEAILSSV
jgi:hypothetical protein